MCQLGIKQQTGDIEYYTWMVLLNLGKKMETDHVEKQFPKNAAYRNIFICHLSLNMESDWN